MPGEYHCPSCRAEISGDDINAITDIALCRACGETSVYSQICGENEVSAAALDEPPKSVRREMDADGSVRIVYRRFSLPTAFMATMGLFAIWAILDSAVRYFSLPMPVALVPFGLLLGGAIVFLIGGCLAIILKQGDGHVFIGVGRFGWMRNFSYNPNTVVSLKQVTDLESDGKGPIKGICIVTGSRAFVFGALIPEQAKHFIAAALAEEIRRQ